jgi:ribosome-binding factor A
MSAAFKPRAFAEVRGRLETVFMSNKTRHTRTRAARSETSTHTSGELAGRRHLRLEHILLHELQLLLADECTDPQLAGVKPIALTLSPDSGHARIAYAVVASLDQEQSLRRTTEAALIRATGFLRSQLAERLELKKLPRLTFTFVGLVDPDTASADGGDS